jgi:sec-independent protein translocase protein TatB
MFNIHSTEIIVVLIVALIVIGPDKLPMAIKTASLWVGRFRRSFHKVKAEIERELNTDEIRRQLHNESVLAELEEAKSHVEKARTDVEGVARETEQSVSNIVNSDDFDPGASKYTDQQKEHADDETSTTIADELDEVSEHIEDINKKLYGSGKNPKLAEAKPDQDTPDQDTPTQDKLAQAKPSQDKQDNDPS